MNEINTGRTAQPIMAAQGFKLAAFHHKPGSVTRAAASPLSAPAGNQRDDNSIS